MIYGQIARSYGVDGWVVLSEMSCLVCACLIFEVLHGIKYYMGCMKIFATCTIKFYEQNKLLGEGQEIGVFSFVACCELWYLGSVGVVLLLS